MNSGHKIITVRGEIEVSAVGICDAHSHIWINPVENLNPDAPVLNQLDAIKEELVDYKNSGGTSLIDCQPGGCGRDGNQLRLLSEYSSVNVVASTGFHLQRYYPADYWLFNAGVDKAAEFFIDELENNLMESNKVNQLVRAGLIKISCEETFEESPVQLIEGAVVASMQTGAPIECHTEKGLDAEIIADEILDFGLPPKKLILCHLDKRPDFGLHQSMVERGVLLEYDTFYRKKYGPEENVWPLLEKMLNFGYGNHILLATDMMETTMCKQIGGPGLAGFIKEIRARLVTWGLDMDTINKLTGENIAYCLAR